MSTEAGKSLIAIQEDEPRVALHPDGPDRERFYRTGQQVIAHCELGISIEVWLEEFQSMLSRVQQWAERHAGQVRSCYCSPRGSHVVVFVLPSSDSFDFELAGELADLNAELLRQFNIGNLEIHQIPWAEADRFIDFATSQRIYGEPRFSPPAVET